MLRTPLTMLKPDDGHGLSDDRFPNDADYRGIRPFKHQVLQVNAMIALELRGIICENEEDERTKVETSLGVLSTFAGSGKTWSAIMLAVFGSSATEDKDGDTTTTPTRSPFTYSVRSDHLSGKVLETKTFRRGYALPTLVVFPSSLAKQWKDTMVVQAKVPKTRLTMLKTFKDNDEAILRHLSPEVAVVMMTTTAYAAFQRSALFDDCVFRRVIIDEADSVSVPKFVYPATRFTWLITATPTNLYDNIAQSSGLRLLPRTTTRNGGFVEEERRYLEMCTVSCDDGYARGSMGILPPLTRTTKFVRKTRLFAALAAAMHPSAIEALEAGDPAGAISAMNCQSVEDEKGMVAAVTGKLDETKKKLEKTLARIRREEEDENDGSDDDDVMMVDEVDERRARRRQERMERIAAEIADIDGKVKCITERVTEAEVCPITMDVFRHPAVTKCCQNKFEMEAVVRAMAKKPTCPMCSAHITPADIVVVAAVNESAEPTAACPSGTRDDPFVDMEQAVRRTVSGILDARPDAKVLVFSKHDMKAMSEGVEKALADRGNFVTLRGTSDRVHTILAAFKNGTEINVKARENNKHPLRVLLVDAKHFGAGMNLEFATHLLTLHKMTDEMDQQVIGRAQRPGRTEPLSVVDIRINDAEV